MKKKHIVLSLFVLLSTLNLVAQDLKLAKFYFDNASYKEAAEYFLKIEDKDQEVLQSLGDSYYFSSEMKNANKWYEKLIKEYEDIVAPEYFFRYSQTLYAADEVKQGNKWLKKYKAQIDLDRKTTPEIEENYKKLLEPNDRLIIHRLNSNTERSEFGGAFYDTTKFIFTASAEKGVEYSWTKENYLDLYQADINANGYLENVEPFSEGINSKWHEANAIFTKDGNTIYFTANNRNGKKKILGRDKIAYLKIYKATKTNNVWGNIEELPFNLDDYITEHPALNKDETKLYFASDRPGGMGSLDLYVVDINADGTYGNPINLGSKINTEKREQFPSISTDTLYFASDGHLGLGGLDIFKTKIKNIGFTKPENLRKGINSSLDDFALVKNEVSGFNYISSNRDGNDDIFLFEMRPSTYDIAVEIRDKTTDEPVDEAIVRFFINDTVVENTMSSEDIIFTTKYNPENTYKVKAEHKLYLPTQVDIDESNILEDNTLVIYLEQYAEIEDQIIVKNNKTQIKHEPIFFDLNSSYLRQESKPKLDKIVEILNKYPDIVIRCESHTDSRATLKYNQWLSDRRAKRTAEYIVSMGIDPTRITQEGYGESQILNGCTDNVNCTEQQHQLNRRTEFVLISKEEINIEE